MNDDPTPRPRPRRAWRTDAEWARLFDRITVADSDPAARGQRRRRTYGIASLAIAAATIVAVPSTLLLLHRATVSPDTRVWTTKPGERMTIQLRDGSVAKLGPSTRLQFASSGGPRSLDLIGLAEFDVAHDGLHPFTVRAGGGVTEDVGTSFVVRAYSSDTIVTVAVASGAVAFSDTSRRQQITLHAGDVGQIGRAGRPQREDDARFQAATAWLDDRLMFDAAPLAEVGDELARWFDVDIRVSDASLAARPVTAVYDHPTLDGVLGALAAALDARWERDGRTVTIRPRASAKP